MHSTTESTPTTMTDGEVSELIVSLVENAPDSVAWADIRSQLPRTNWRAGELAVALHLSGRIYASKWHGRTYLCEPLTGSVAA
ncbi:hypothetical protein [Williamsia maris]|uniref:DUF3253 domain-containing protein n=1 Tax=Williamsia maris TaxID=72806 RepID=A0ABT1HL62_9NOCA|nr:hypothetical protein [Williamsia maris]MCP2178686.1 hypothetical protein [Williamsia maris]